ncbi:MAG: hypothetical protein QOJ42_3821, partial [Acidobacteriaceae bacterium]|nr:hypothetical protein [Acidobacteriaceae bacterium]
MIFQMKELLDRVFYPFYVLRGRRPWTPGYYTAKRRRIESAIENGLLKPAAPLPK